MEGRGSVASDHVQPWEVERSDAHGATSDGERIVVGNGLEPPLRSEVVGEHLLAHVTVLDSESKAAIQGARLYVARHRFNPLVYGSKTDATGKATIGVPYRGSEGIVGACAEGYVAAELVVGGASSDGREELQLQIELKRGGEVKGVVAWGGYPPPVDRRVRVLAFTPNTFPSAGWAAAPERAPNIEAETQSTEVDDLGRFVLSGLRVGHPHLIVAMGEGVVSAFVRDVIPPAEGLNIELDTLFGVSLSLEGVDGRKIKTDPLLHSGGMNWSYEGPEESSFVPLGSPVAQWVGAIEGDSAPAGVRGDIVPLIYRLRGKHIRDRAGPLAVSVGIPGYLPFWSQEVWAFPISGQGLVQQEVRLKEAASFGDLRIKWVGLPGEPWFPGMVQPNSGLRYFGVLALRGGHGQYYTGGVVLKEEGTWFHGIPIGEYAARLNFADLRLAFPPPDSVSGNERDLSVVVSEETAEISIDLSAMGGVLVKVLLPGGGEYGGAASFVIRDLRGAAHRKRVVRFDCAPYAIFPLESGACEVRVQRVAGFRPDPAWLGLEIVPNELHEVAIAVGH